MALNSQWNRSPLPNSRRILPTMDDLPGLTAEHPILITDDSLEVILLHGLCFRRQNLTTLNVVSSYDVLDLARIVPVSLIISDVSRPDMDGFTLLRHLRADPASWHIPLMYCSACVSTRTQVAGLALGAIAYLTKPIHPAELLNAVQQALIQHGNWQPVDVDWRAVVGDSYTLEAIQSQIRQAR